jgi:hypothetical protein
MAADVLFPGRREGFPAHSIGDYGHNRVRILERHPTQKCAKTLNPAQALPMPQLMLRRIRDF